MSERIYYVVNDSGEKLYDEKGVEFWYFRGFAASQKRKSIVSMHEAIKKASPGAKILEVSLYSPERVGVKLCDQNLKMQVKKLRRYVSVKCLFEASKVFEAGGPFVDLLKVTPDEASSNKRLKNSGQLIKYVFEGQEWGTVPSNMFYDYLYLRTLCQNSDFLNEALKYDVFTDIEPSQENAVDCPARAVAIAVGLKRRGLLEKSLESKEAFEKVYKLTGQTEQISLF